MKIKRKETGGLGRISLVDGKRELGYLLYRREALRLDALSTVVAPEMRGQGLAEQLAEALRALSERQRLFIRPTCSYIERLMQARDSWARYSEECDSTPEVMDRLYAEQDETKAREMARFFQAGKGGYAEGDVFLGISVPQLRRMIWTLAPWTLTTICSLAQRREHEARALAFFLLAERMRRCDGSPDDMERTYRIYVELFPRCNNWDLVDVSAPTLVGLYWRDRDPEERRRALLELAGSGDLWVQRIAIVGTQGLIRFCMAEDALALAEALLPHPHHLIHKAVGWTLRELGRRVDEDLLLTFLDEHAPRMPRTALRYALERLRPEQRQHYMAMR